MKAVGKLERAPGVRQFDTPEPSVGPNDLLIAIRKTSICGTDVHIYNWDAWSQENVKVPLILGHEYMGVVAEVGSEVEGFAVGDRVSGEGHLTCGHCRNCRAGRRHLCRNTKGVGIDAPGAFAEFLALPAANAFKIPDEIPDDLAAIFDPLGNAVHAALSFDLVGEDVLITGAGPIGAMAAAVCRFVGARHVVVTDINDYRLELAAKLGANRTVNVQSEPDLAGVMAELNMQEGFDVALEMSGAPAALADMFAVMNHGGKVALLGIQPGESAVDLNRVIFKGLFIKGIYGREMFDTWYKMASMIQAGLNIDTVITHRLSADSFQQGFDVMRSGRSGKILLDWSQSKQVS